MTSPTKDKLSIEHIPFYTFHYITILCTVLCLTILSIYWKTTQDARHIQWKSHSSYYSSQGRVASIQNSKKIANLYFIGSSITGRIPGMETGIHKWANLGVDGSSSYEGLKIIQTGIVPPPKYIIVETDTLYNPTIRPVFNESDFKKIGNLGAINNPIYRISSLLYTELRHYKYNITQTYQLNETPPLYLSKPKHWNSWDSQCLQMLLSLQKNKDCKILLVSFPNKNKSTPKDRHEKSLFLASILKCPYLDLNTLLPQNANIRFTDGIHMTCTSAMEIASSLYNFCMNKYQPNKQTYSTSH